MAAFGICVANNFLQVKFSQKNIQIRICGCKLEPVISMSPENFSVDNANLPNNPISPSNPVYDSTLRIISTQPFQVIKF